MTKIMIVDDEPDTLVLVEAILTTEGFDVVKFNTSTNAFDFIKKGGKADLILLDMRMPNLSGPDFCEKLKKEKIKGYRIVFFTASSDFDKSLAKKSGALGYIFKPFSNDTLVKQIKKFLKTRTY